MKKKTGRNGENRKKQEERERNRKTGEKPVEIPAPIFSEKPVDESVCYTEECKSLGGEMRLCAPWVSGCN